MEPYWPDRRSRTNPVSGANVDSYAKLGHQAGGKGDATQVCFNVVHNINITLDGGL